MLTASINGINEIKCMKKGEEQIDPQGDGEITSREGGEEIAPQEEEIAPPHW